MSIALIRGNLHRIFEAARRANVILFFDEADAMLGRRSEVNDAHDRYANIEVAYLLPSDDERLQAAPPLDALERSREMSS